MFFYKKCYQTWWKKQAKVWQYALPMLVECKFTTINVDFWMSKRTHDVFSLLIHLLVIDLGAKEYYNYWTFWSC
jgi:hypothetical protein